MRILIFDVDGTILYTIESIAYYINFALKEYGLEEVGLDLVIKNLGNGSKVLVDGILESMGVQNEKLSNEIIEMYHKNYFVNPQYLTREYDGISDMLKDLKKNNILVAYSNKPDFVLQPLMKVFFENGLFDHIKGQDDRFCKKPDICFLEELSKKYSTKNIYIIGDSDVDMMTANNFGAHSLAVLWGYREKSLLEKYNPEFIFEKVSDLKEFLCKMN